MSIMPKPNELISLQRARELRAEGYVFQKVFLYAPQPKGSTRVIVLDANGRVPYYLRAKGTVTPDGQRA